MDRRIVVEHPDGRRVSVDEGQFDAVEANPFNRPGDVTSHDADARRTVIRRSPGRPPEDHVSLKREGFEAVMAIDPETGWEIPLEAPRAGRGGD